MAMRRKGDLPRKPCAVCGRPFAWRRKWAAVWDEVKYCSDKCRRARSSAAGRAAAAEAEAAAGAGTATGAPRDRR